MEGISAPKKESSSIQFSDTVVLAQGENTNSQLGIGSVHNIHYFSPVEIPFFNSSIKLNQISVGGSHSLALTTDGRVFCWGFDGNNQCGGGSGKNEMIFSPTPIHELEGHDIIQVAAGGSHSLALTSHGQVFVWGYNKWGACGLEKEGENIPHPTLLPDLNNIVKISAGGFHSLILTNTGTVLGFGNNDFSQLGFESTKTALISKPTLIPHLENIIDVTCGTRHSLALDKSSNVYGWGSALFHSVPKMVANLSHIVQMSAGNTHSLFLDRNGKIFFWGMGAFPKKQTGLHASIAPHHALTPISINIFEQTKFKQVIAGAHHSFAITESGSVIGWGKNLGNKPKEIGKGFNSIATSFQSDYWFLYTSHPMTKVSDRIARMQPTSTYLSDMKGAYSKTKFNDIVISSKDGKKFPAHQLILSLRCSPELLIKWQLLSEKDQNSQDTKPITPRYYLDQNTPFNLPPIQIREVKLDYSSTVVKTFLDYLYLDSIDEEETLPNLVELLGLSDQFHMMILKQSCESLLIEKISTDNSPILFLSSSKYKAFHLQNRVKNFIYKHFGEVTQSSCWKEELGKNSKAFVELFAGLEKQQIK